MYFNTYNIYLDFSMSVSEKKKKLAYDLRHYETLHKDKEKLVFLK
jgi:hypothetical protein